MTPLAAYLLLFTIVGIGFIFIHLVAGKLIRPSKPDAEKGTIYECGEPTIGSAWVQFDLRFYVVALLFVIFDVEVAFFFPWAEVFGKANAVATAEKPQTAEEYVAYAEKVQDLALPVDTSPTSGGAPSAMGAAHRYEKITGRRADGRPLLDEDGKPLGPLTNDKLKTIRDDHKAARQRFAERNDVRIKLDKVNATLAAEEAKKKKADAAALKRLREEKKSLQTQYDQTAPSKAEEEAVGLSGPLKEREFEENRDTASSLAWMALVEVLVFFGVLLVGFAYLWRRGDLEWVRSTAAERLAARGITPPTSPPSAAPPMEAARPREPAGAGH